MTICDKLRQELNEEYVRIDNVVDNLVTLDTNKPLSANQGFELNTRMSVIQAELDSLESGVFDELIDYIGDVDV